MSVGRELPADRERALDAIAGGWGRTASPAHPLCICGKPTGAVRTDVVALDGQPVPVLGRAKDCPMHRPRR